MRLRRLLYEIITPLLSHNELIDHGRLAFGTHVFRLYSFTDPVAHANKHPRLDQTWVELLHFPQQNLSIDPFIYCKEEQELRCEESDEHPRHLEEEATCGGVTSDGYVKVQSAPYAND